MQRRIVKVVSYSLNTRFSPLVYLFVMSSFVTGAAFTFLSYLPDVQNTILYKYGVVGGITIWGAVLLIGMIILLVGLIKDAMILVRVGAFLGFMLWLFGSLTYLLNGFYYVLLAAGLLHMLAHGFIYLKAAQGSLRSL